MNLEDIKKSRLFQGMTEKELSSCLDCLNAKEMRFRKDDVILHAGDQTSNIGMVCSGSVTIESNDVWGNCTVLSHVGKNQYFAETYALLGEVLLVDVIAFLKKVSYHINVFTFIVCKKYYQPIFSTKSVIMSEIFMV